MEGDHIYVDCGFYEHHGIDCGDGTVIQFSKIKGKISHDSMSSFASTSLDGNIYAYDYENCYSPSVVVQRAKSKLGESGYNLFGNNCEHFATWCKTGQCESEQVETVSNIAGNIGGTALVTLGLAEATVAAPGILGFLGMTTTVPLLGAAALPATILGGAFLAYKLISGNDDW